MSNIRVGFILFAVLAASVSLSSCSTLVGVGTAVGVAAVQERGVRGRAADLKIEALILKDFLARGLKMTTVIGVEVYDGRVLLTGFTKDTKVSDEAVRIAWKTRGVKKVINEIKLENERLSERLRDLEDTHSEQVQERKVANRGQIEQMRTEHKEFLQTAKLKLEKEKQQYEDL